jgi:hypothetical protein
MVRFPTTQDHHMMHVTTRPTPDAPDPLRHLVPATHGHRFRERAPTLGKRKWNSRHDVTRHPDEHPPRGCSMLSIAERRLSSAFALLPMAIWCLASRMDAWRFPHAHPPRMISGG